MKRAFVMLSMCLCVAAAWAEKPQAAPSAQSASVPAVWNLGAIFPDDAAWETERRAVQAALPSLTARKGSLGHDASALAAALDEASRLTQRIARLSSYASLKADEDTRVAANQARTQLADNLEHEFRQAAAFIGPEIIALGRDKVAGFEAAEPALAKHHYLLASTLREAPHTLSASEEGLLASAASPLSQAQEIYGLLANADIPWPTLVIRGKPVLLDQEGYVAHRDDRDPLVRKRVFDTFWPVFKAYERTFGATYLANLRATVFSAKARNYPSSLAAALSHDNTPEAVYRTLIAEANAGLPTLHRYFALSKKLLGLKEMRYSDVYVPLAKPPRQYSLAEAEQLTLKGVASLGDEYVQTLGQAFAGSWMHATAQRGKRSGAYMNGAVYDVHPFVLMSFNGGYDSVSTLAHEWGHAMHSVLANRAQPYETADYALFVAEIPSTTNEMLLADYVISHAKTREEKIFALSQELELLRGTFFRQAQFAEFELAAHEAVERGEALTGERLSAMYLDLLRRYYGEREGAVKIDDKYGIEWAYVPHFYNDFYVFKYATSISAAAYFAEGIGKGDTALRERYFDVLKAGGSDDPYLIVKRAGLDMATPAPYRAVIQRMNRLMDELEALEASKS